MNALLQNEYTAAWQKTGETLPKPQAILCISAHWYISSTAVTASSTPRTIHDFGGFPPQLYQVQYPAPGSIELAKRIQQILKPTAVHLDETWGLDHGAWSVLIHLYPDADIPVVQLSIDETQPPQFHFDLGTKLAPLREENVLIVGSGNLVHNLHTYAWGGHMPEPYDWATRFENSAREKIVTGNFQPLIDYDSLGRDAMLSIPTPDHYLPLLYVLGTKQQKDAILFPVEGIDGGSVSMLAVQVG